MGLIDIALARFDAFLNRIQGFQLASRDQSYRMQQPFKNQLQKRRAVALFGSDPNEAFGLDWVSYGASKPQGPGNSPVQKELQDFDRDPEKPLAPNPDVPLMISHGKTLNYGNKTDQRPIVGFQGEIGDVWDGKIRNTPKQTFQSVRGNKQLTDGDQAALDLKNLGWDFSV